MDIIVKSYHTILCDIFIVSQCFSTPPPWNYVYREFLLPLCHVLQAVPASDQWRTSRPSQGGTPLCTAAWLATPTTPSSGTRTLPCCPSTTARGPSRTTARWSCPTCSRWTPGSTTARSWCSPTRWTPRASTSVWEVSPDWLTGVYGWLIDGLNWNSLLTHVQRQAYEIYIGVKGITQKRPWAYFHCGLCGSVSVYIGVCKCVKGNVWQITCYSTSESGGRPVGGWSSATVRQRVGAVGGRLGWWEALASLLRASGRAEGDNIK